MALELDAYYNDIDYNLLLPTSAPLIAPSTYYDSPYLAEEEEDQQLLLHLNAFLSDFDLPSTDSNHLSLLHHNYQYPQEQLPLYPDHYDYFDYSMAHYDYSMPEPPPKRQKCINYSNNNYVVAPPFQPPSFPPPQPFCGCTTPGRTVNVGDKGKELGKGRATAQSVAARDRRKKISDKTVELGKLIPGAVEGKMNTAEMLQHAFNYVLFMQSQLSLLQLMPSLSSKEEEKEQMKAEESLQIVGSSGVQEKLYMNDKCLVPVHFLDDLAMNGDLESQGSISTDLKELIKSISV